MSDVTYCDLELGVYAYDDDDATTFRMQPGQHIGVVVRQPLTEPTFRIDLLILSPDRTVMQSLSFSQPAAQAVSASIENAFGIIARLDAEREDQERRIRAAAKKVLTQTTFSGKPN